jgi:hypothetical protein
MGSEWILERLAGGVEWIQLSQDRGRWQAIVNTVMNMKFRVFWDVVPCSHVEVDRLFGGAIALMMEALHTSETSVNFNVTTRRYIAEDSKLRTRRRKNLKSHTVMNLLNLASRS